MMRFNTMFLDGRDTSPYDQKSVRCETDTSGWNRQWSTLRLLCHRFVDPRGMLDMSMLLHAEERSYALCVFALVHLFGKTSQPHSLDLCCCGGPFDRLYLVQDAEHWLGELNF